VKKTNKLHMLAERKDGMPFHKNMLVGLQRSRNEIKVWGEQIRNKM
jgi:hypothetical protein